MEKNDHDHVEFLEMFPDIVRDLAFIRKNKELEAFYTWYEKVLRYNILGGKLTRGMMVAKSFSFLADPEEVTEKNLRLAHTLGWSIELLQSFFLVADDLMDNSKTRRGRPCWYLTNNLGTKALNDALLLERGAFCLLKKHHHDKPHYVNCHDLLNDVTFKTCQGQALDLLTASGSKPQFHEFTPERYAAIVKYKTGYYSFYLPVAMAMYMAGLSESGVHLETERVLLKMGELFQVQDDFLDCFGDSQVMGKIGTDIQEGKCTWLVVQALQRADNTQRTLLQECYGQDDPAQVAKVKKLYQNLELSRLYAEYEERTYDAICQDIQDLSCTKIQKLCTVFLNKIRSRKN